MRVVVPFVRSMLQPETEAALGQTGRPVEWVSVHPDHQGRYAQLVEDLWKDGEAFCLVEQDVVPTPAMLDGLEACDGPWCSHCYDDPDYHRAPMLGLARFSAGLTADRPEVGVSALRTDRTRSHHVPWRSLNEALSRHLVAHHVPWHRHLPDVAHLHGRPLVAG